MLRRYNSFDDLVDIRPWGWYEIILDHPKTKVKLITVKPNSRLSYQYHHKRQEQWTVVSGNLTIVLENQVNLLKYHWEQDIGLGMKQIQM